MVTIPVYDVSSSIGILTMNNISTTNNANTTSTTSNVI